VIDDGVTTVLSTVEPSKYLQESGVEHLFDLLIDPGEKTDMRNKRADVFEKLRTAYGTWNTQMLPRP
jgi:hypothetical protein